MTDPSPVTVTNPEPIDVKVSNTDTLAQTTARIVAARAGTEEEALTTEGQRRINLIWERTQAIIAISVVEVTLLVVAIIIVAPLLVPSIGEASATAAVTGLVLLSNLVGNVTGFYFSRTNHTKTGGVGSTMSLPRRRGE